METINQAKRELTLTRILDAPRELVFQVWTEKEPLAKWWGPKGFTNPVCEIDLRPDGKMRIDMKGPDGIVYPMTGVVKEFIRPEKFVFISNALDQNGKPMFEIMNTITFEAQGNKTKLTVHVNVINVIAADAEQYLVGMNQGWNQSLDRLAEFVTKN